MEPLLEIRDLTVCIPNRFGQSTAIENIDLMVQPGEIHGLVGESGAGKSTAGAAIIGLLSNPAYIAAGTIKLRGDELTTLDESTYHQIRGKRISMIFQDPQTSLNPLLTVADQLIETIRQHNSISASDAHSLAIDLLRETGIEAAEVRIHDYPHQFSGGMRQRVVIALALCTNPDLIIADEPTTALDVSVQKQILELLRSLADRRSTGFILITHDLGVIAQITDNVTVLRRGCVVESGPTRKVLSTPQHPYTQAMLAAVPRLDKRLDRFSNIVNDELSAELSAELSSHAPATWQIQGAGAATASQWLLTSGDDTQREQNAEKNRNAQPLLLELQGVEVTYGQQRGWLKKRPGFKALQAVDMQLRHGEVLGLVGESGSGKSTIAKAVVGLVPVSAGQMFFCGEPLPDAAARSRNHNARRQIQMIFQDPYSSLNNRRTVEAILAEPLRFYGLASNGSESRRLIASMLELVEMPQRSMLKYPHQFSGGQRQRIAVARALMAKPDFLICDEPTSALDVSIQAHLLNLLKDLQAALELTILFITHDLPVVRQMADRIMVLRAGEVVETAQSETFFEAPEAQYSRQLLRESPSVTWTSHDAEQ
jgi:peptide/nickel transport system ATP-binding protein